MTILRRFLSATKNRLLSRVSHSKSNYSTNEIPKKVSIVSKFGIFIGLISLPVAGFVIYDRLAGLPLELQNLNFPLPARFYIRRALCPANSIQETARYLDLAMQKVLLAGIGSASPESTALVLFLARLYLETDGDAHISDLEAAHYALTFKPHVGEAVKEELARVELSFKVADKLCKFYSTAGHENDEKVQFYAHKSIELMENSASYLKSKFENHPLKSQFLQYHK
jgi:hypothetical protein